MLYLSLVNPCLFRRNWAGFFRPYSNSPLFVQRGALALSHNSLLWTKSAFHLQHMEELKHHLQHPCFNVTFSFCQHTMMRIFNDAMKVSAPAARPAVVSKCTRADSDSWRVSRALFNAALSSLGNVRADATTFLIPLGSTASLRGRGPLVIQSCSLP